MLHVEAQFGRLPKTEFKILRDKFIANSDRLDKQHLERLALTASQLRERIDQSRELVKIVTTEANSRDVSPMFEQQSLKAKDRDRAKALKTLLEANARWNATRRDASKNDIRRLVDETSTINPVLRTELLYSWEKGFIDKPTEEGYAESPILLRKDENGKSGKALKNPLKGRVMAPTPSTVSTAAGSIYIKKATLLYQRSSHP